MAELKQMRTECYFMPHGTTEAIKLPPGTTIVMMPSYGTRRTDAGIYVDRIDNMAGQITTYGPFADYDAADDCARAHLLRDQVHSSLDALDNLHGYGMEGWTADEIANDLVLCAPSLDGRDPADLVPAVEAWLQRRRKG